jgi:hypothetical protein
MSIKIDTNIPYGNACDISIDEYEETAEIGFAPDPHGGPECLWFCFQLIRKGSEPIEKIKLVLKHSYNMLGGGNAAIMRPVIRYAEGDWLRLDKPIVKKLPDGRNLVSWTIDAPSDFVDVAYCYPYGREDVDALISDTNGYWKADTIGVSQGARPLIRLSNSYGEIGSQRSGLYLIARQHSAEVSGSWVLDGFLRYITSMGDDAPLIWSVPLTNIDGVEQGDYGKDNFPYDLNRAWGSPPMRHEVLVFQRDVRRWKERCKPVLALDFHAPGATESNGIYCFLPNPAKYPDHNNAVLKFADAMGNNLGGRYAASPFGRIADYDSRWETPRFSNHFWSRHKIPAFGIETPYAMINDLVLTRERYRKAGELIASSIIDIIQDE